ncbi:MAG TPA: type I-U CRISPR-associated protein Csx17 [Fibrobacteraceae bacterium]|nr:type I-U CRISPR-associated protein Csx17 [Fibrobacteraceae bacterium]
MIYKHILKGCQPTPLAHYLKAVGILRLVSEQKDPACRGAWHDDYFVLATKLNQDELETFFLEEYEPTAFVAPWNKGSGFYQKDDPGLKPIEQSNAPRFQNWAKGIQASKDLIAAIVQADAETRSIKNEAKKIKNKTERKIFENSEDYKNRLNEANRQFKGLKADLIPDCHNNWRGSHLEWMQSALVLDENGEPKFPALLGSGGNDGRLDFTNNLMQRLQDLFDLSKPAAPAKQEAEAQLKSALWENPTNKNLNGAAIGQYSPGVAGGANNSTGSTGDSVVNPWDFVLMLEGAVLFSASATKRLSTIAQVNSSAPFTFPSHASGSLLSIADEYHKFGSPQQSKGRGEQWMPLWNQWVNLAELKALLAEGRAQIGKSYAMRPVDMARAVSRLGVARGIDSFVRYGYLERNGQANFAVPLGKMLVPHQPRPRSYLVDDLAPWMDRLHRKARDKAPSRLIQAERNLADAVFDALTHDDTPSRWQAILLAAVEVEKIQASGTGFEIGPIPPLSPEWVEACDDGSAEFRLALALGGAYYSENQKKYRSIRCHWLPLDEKSNRKYATSDKRLAHDVRVVTHGRSADQDLIELLNRRYLESIQSNERHPQIIARRGLEATLPDLSAWIDGCVDRERCVQLARAFMAIEWWKRNEYHPVRSCGKDWPEDAWCALKLCALPWELDSDKEIPLDPAILRRLQSGNGEEALRLSLRRLQAHDIRPALGVPFVDPEVVLHWASALAFPISKNTARSLFNYFQTQNKETSYVH